MIMWFLEWTSGKSGYDSDEHTHVQKLSDTLGINDKVEANELAIIAWEEARENSFATIEMYRFPQLVWKEPLVN